MKATSFALLILGLVLGALLATVGIALAAPRLMIVEDASPHGFDETVSRIVAAAEARQWKVPAVHDLRESMQKAGHDVDPATVIELCRPDYAVRILAEDRERVVTSMMPCRIAVYRTSDGSVVVSRMNTTLVARLFGGLISQVMAGASADSEAILATALGNN